MCALALNCAPVSSIESALLTASPSISEPLPGIQQAFARQIGGLECPLPDSIASVRTENRFSASSRIEHGASKHACDSPHTECLLLNLKSRAGIQANNPLSTRKSNCMLCDLHVTLIRFARFSSVTLVTLKSTFTINGATQTEPRKVLLKSDCSEHRMCYYRDRSGKLNNVPRNGH